MTFNEAEIHKRKHQYLINKCFISAIITHLVVVPKDAPYDIIKQLIVDRINNPFSIDEDLEDFDAYGVLVVCAEHFHLDKSYWNYDLEWVLAQPTLFWEN